MTIYQYVVSSHPDNWSEGHYFATAKDARDFMSAYGKHGACLTELSFTYEDSELVEDTRPVSEEV